MIESDISCQQIDNFILLLFWKKYESINEVGLVRDNPLNRG
jgi:hypothetical protein